MTQRGFIPILLVVAFSLILVGIGVYSAKRIYQTEPSNRLIPRMDNIEPKKSSIASERKITSDGLIQINEGEILIFSSGAVLTLSNNRLHFLYQADIPDEEILTFSKKISIYANGYLHTLKDVTCKNESRFFGDYSMSVVVQCSMDSLVQVNPKPDLPKYKAASINFATVASEKVPRFSTLLEEPWIAATLPYFQIAKNDRGVVVNVVSPRDDIVNIYTNYGRVEFQFDADELNNKKEKTIIKGPLTLRLIPEELSCAAQYKLNDGSCYVLDWQGTKTTTYNLVNFKLEIDEKDTPTDHPLLLDIE